MTTFATPHAGFRDALLPTRRSSTQTPEVLCLMRRRLSRSHERPVLPEALRPRRKALRRLTDLRSLEDAGILHVVGLARITPDLLAM